MSSCDECKKNHQSQCGILINTAAKDAVFTVSQTEKIVQIAGKLDECVIKAIESVKPCDYSNQLACLENDIQKLEKEVKRMECEIDGLVSYDEKNTEDIECIESNIAKLACEIEKLKKGDNIDDAKMAALSAEINKLQCEIKTMSEKIGHALLSQAKELDRVANQLECVEDEIKADEAKVSKLACDVCKVDKEVDHLQCEVKELASEVACLAKKDHKDDRIDAILAMLSSMCTRAELCALEKADKAMQCEIEKIQCELKKLVQSISCMGPDSRIETILKRLACLEVKKYEDARVEALMCEIAKLEKQMACQEAVNVRQQKSIDALYTQNVHQAEDIKCLFEKVKDLSCKLDRNSVTLQNEIDCLEKEEYADKKLDASQSAQIVTMQSQMVKMQGEIDRLEKALLVRPC